MGKNKDKKERVDLVKIVNHGDRMIIPDGLSLKQARTVIDKQIEYEEGTVSIHAPVDGFMPDAAHAFHLALTKIFGWTNGVPTPGFWGTEQPAMMSVQTGPDERVDVPWGRVTVPGVEGWLSTGATELADHRLVFVIQGEIKRKHLPVVQRIIRETEQQIREHSVLRGKAFALRLTDHEGDRIHLPEPKFWHINRTILNDLVFNREVQDAIDVNIFAPLRNRELARTIGIPPRRGVLLSGKFGTGKSMTATAVADVATQHGWTFIICESANDFSQMLAIARDYAPAVLFCEDIDQVLTGHRNVDMNAILNSVDSVVSKSQELMIILTTNNVESITRAMLRPGRLDAIIEVTAPDAEAAARLMVKYGRGLVDPHADLTAAASLMDGVIPAVIQEVVERAKLAAIARGVTHFGEGTLEPDDLLRAARGMTNQQRLLAEKEPDVRDSRQKSADSLGASIVEAAKIESGWIPATSNGVAMAAHHTTGADDPTGEEILGKPKAKAGTRP